MNKNILVVAAHADDEVLGCGGTIAKHIHNNDHVSVCFLTDGVSARDTTSVSDTEIRTQATYQAMTSLGVKDEDIHQFDFPDNKMDTLPLLDIVKKIEALIVLTSPNVIYTHFRHDLNIDHQKANQAVLTACRPQNSSCVKKILSFEVLSSTEWESPSLPSFKPQYINNITHFWQAKERALKCYHQEMRAFPHSRSYQCVEALATLRGATHGYQKAEAFFVEKIRID
jgi:LmbE family N-acetylglucosaminyl deacetylase